METKHKEFKPFDKVLVLLGTEKVWTCDLYSHYDNEYKCHRTFKGYLLPDEEILPYEGNEHLVGTTDEPDEDVKLEEGEWIMVANDYTAIAQWYSVRQYYKIDNSLSLFRTKIGKTEGTWVFAIRFSDFNPNDMEETKKHILCVKNGKVVKYKG